LQFDLACSYNSFEYFSEPAVTLAEMVRVVKPDGLIHIEFNDGYSGKSYPESYLNYEEL